LSVNAVEMPAVQQLISNSTQLSVSVERFAYVAEQLPKQLSTEREEIVKALQAQEKGIASLMEQGTEFSASLNTTFTTFDASMLDNDTRMYEVINLDRMRWARHERRLHFVVEYYQGLSSGCSLGHARRMKGQSPLPGRVSRR
jgi:hypothetical protein